MSRDPQIRITRLDGGSLAESVERDPTALPHPRRGETLWLDLVDPDPATVAAVSAVLGLHPLVAEDISEGNQRAKVEVTDELVHLVLFAFGSDLESPVEVDLVLGRGFLVTAHDGRYDPRAAGRLRSGLAAVLAQGPAHLLWAISDDIVDGYFPIVDRFGDEIDELQDIVLERGDRDTLARLFALKREMLAVRRAISPTREVFHVLNNRTIPLLEERETFYFRDVYDHLIRLADELDTYRELASGTLDVYLSTVNNNLSSIMKRLTGITVILSGVGAIGGIFGMSEASAAFSGGEATGFWLVVAFAVGSAVGAVAFLRRIDWI